MTAVKFAKLLDKISENTDLGAIHWQLDEFGDPYFELNGRKVFVEESVNEEIVPVMVVRILNTAGQLVEKFTDDDLRNREPPAGMSFFDYMKELQQKAIRQATGADKAVDELISDLDGLVPF
ncbi:MULTISPECIES: hypothetical protein [unclassified Phenylobacterium]|jgi:hypothetical protein|uniref:hypothetical protein n=1 Tax=unclassified Phenylobacterium TaxID=2640670 RepID=UPI000839F584|nr:MULTISPECIES: hypothetical protein [unclassified Phenylobacterium]